MFTATIPALPSLRTVGQTSATCCPVLLSHRWTVSVQKHKKSFTFYEKYVVKAARRYCFTMRQIPSTFDSRKVMAAADSGDHSRTMDDIIALLQTGKTADRIKAVRESVFLEDKDEALEFLCSAAIEDPSAQVRYLAVSMIADVGHIDKEKCAEVLRDRVLKDGEINVRAGAADSMIALKIDGAYDSLIKAYEDTKPEDWVFRMTVVAGLGELQDPRAFDFLTQIATNEETLEKEEPVCVAATGALGDLGDPRAIDVLKTLVNSSHMELANRAKMSLAFLGVQQE